MGSMSAANPIPEKHRISTCHMSKRRNEYVATQELPARSRTSTSQVVSVQSRVSLDRIGISSSAIAKSIRSCQYKLIGTRIHSLNLKFRAKQAGTMDACLEAAICVQYCST